MKKLLHELKQLKSTVISGCKRVASIFWSWLRVHCHCLWNMNRMAFHGEDHRVCSYSNCTDGTRYFCTCGYLNNGITWDEFKKRWERDNAVRR